MPKRADLQMGSGPIVIGQAAEFGSSGTQAVRAPREEGYQQPGHEHNRSANAAGATYIEPIISGVGGSDRR